MDTKKHNLVQRAGQAANGRLLWCGPLHLPPGSVLSPRPFERICQTSQQMRIAEVFGQACIKCCIILFYCIKITTGCL